MENIIKEAQKVYADPFVADGKKPLLQLSP
jgi:hypothetical protein